MQCVTSFREASEHFARYILIRLGLKILSPEVGCEYDFLLETKDGYKKIQVKSAEAKAKSGNFIFSLVRFRSNTLGTKKRYYTSQEVDFFFLVSSDEEVWMIPFNLLEGKKTVTPKSLFPQYKIWPLGGMADAGDLKNLNVR